MSDGAGGSSTAAPRALPGCMADATQTAPAGTAAAAPPHKAMGPSAYNSAQQLPQTTSASGSARPRLAGAGMQRALSSPHRPAAPGSRPPARPVAPRRPGGGSGMPPAPQAASNAVATPGAPASLAPVATLQQRLPAAEPGHSPSPVRRKKGDDSGDGAPRVLPRARPLPTAGRALPALPRALPAAGAQLPGGGGRSHSVPAKHAGDISALLDGAGAAARPVAAGRAAAGAEAAPPAAGLGSARATAVRPRPATAAVQPPQRATQAAQPPQMPEASEGQARTPGAPAATSVPQGGLSARQAVPRRPPPPTLQRTASAAAAAPAASAASAASSAAAAPQRRPAPPAAGLAAAVPGGTMRSAAVAASAAAPPARPAVVPRRRPQTASLASSAQASVGVLATSSANAQPPAPQMSSSDSSSAKVLADDPPAAAAEPMPARSARSTQHGVQKLPLSSAFTQGPAAMHPVAPAALDRPPAGSLVDSAAGPAGSPRQQLGRKPAAVQMSTAPGGAPPSADVAGQLLQPEDHGRQRAGASSSRHASSRADNAALVPASVTSAEAPALPAVAETDAAAKAAAPAAASQAAAALPPAATSNAADSRLAQPFAGGPPPPLSPHSMPIPFGLAPNNTIASQAPAFSSIPGMGADDTSSFFAGLGSEQTEFDAFLAEQPPSDFDPAAYDMQHGDEAGLGSQQPSELAPQSPIMQQQQGAPELQLQHQMQHDHHQQQQQPPPDVQQDDEMSAAPYEQLSGADPQHNGSAEQQQPAPSRQPGDHQSPSAAAQHDWQPHAAPQHPPPMVAGGITDHATAHQEPGGNEHHELQPELAGQEQSWDPGAYEQQWSSQQEQQQQQQQQDGQQWDPAAYEQMSWQQHDQQRQQQLNQRWDPAAYGQQQAWSGQQGQGAEEWQPHESQLPQPYQHAGAVADPTQPAMQPEPAVQSADVHQPPVADDASAAVGAAAAVAAAEPDAGSLALQQQAAAFHPAAAAQDATVHASPADTVRQPPADIAAPAVRADEHAAHVSIAAEHFSAKDAAPVSGDAAAAAAAPAAAAHAQMHQSDVHQAEELPALPQQPAEPPVEQSGQQQWQQEAEQQVQQQQAGEQTANQRPPNEQPQWQQPEAFGHQDAAYAQCAADHHAEDAYWQQDAAYVEGPLQPGATLQNGTYQQQYDAFTDSLGVQHMPLQPQHQAAESLHGGATQQWGEAPGSQGGDQWQQWQPQQDQQAYDQWQQPVPEAEQHWPQPKQPTPGYQQWQQQPPLQPQKQPHSQNAAGWQQPQQPSSLRQTAGAWQQPAPQNPGYSAPMPAPYARHSILSPAGSLSPGQGAAFQQQFQQQLQQGGFFVPGGLDASRPAASPFAAYTAAAPPQHEQQQQAQRHLGTQPRTVRQALETPAGRPPCALAAFGFGGRVVLMRPRPTASGVRPAMSAAGSSFSAEAAGGWEDAEMAAGTLQLLRLSQLPGELALQQPQQPPQGVRDDSRAALERFPGPLSPANSREKVSKLAQECADASSSEPWCPQPEDLKALWQVLGLMARHGCLLQQQGQGSGAATPPSSMRGPAAVRGPAADAPGAAVELADVLTAASGWQGDGGGALLLPRPGDGALVAAAAEAQRLLLAGRRADALRAAQSGGLWGPALLLARGISDAAFADAAAAMATATAAPGCPLHTALLAAAGAGEAIHAAAPAGSPRQYGDGGQAASVAPAAGGGDGGELLARWRENLAVLAANAAPGAERAVGRLGHRLACERCEVAAAQLCYVVAGGALHWAPEPGDPSGKLCLVGADAAGQPRTCASIAALQRTQIYQWALVSGNPAAAAGGLPLLAYDVVYASLLAEQGLLREALAYVSAVQASIGALPRLHPGLLVARAQAADLASRLQAHAQANGISVAGGGGGGILKGVGRWLDRGINRLIGIDAPGGGASSDDEFAHPAATAHRRRATADMARAPSAGPAPVQRRVSSSRDLRRVSGGSATSAAGGPPPPAQPPQGAPHSDPSAGRPGAPTAAAQGSGGGGAQQGGSIAASLSRGVFSRVGSLLGSGSGGGSKREARLGEENAFYYDEATGRWQERGKAPVAEPPPPPPPPKAAPLPPPPAGAAPAAAAPPLRGVRSRYVDPLNAGSGGGGGLRSAAFAPPPGAFAAKGVAAAPVPAFFVPGGQSAANSIAASAAASIPTSAAASAAALLPASAAASAAATPAALSRQSSAGLPPSGPPSHRSGAAAAGTPAWATPASSTQQDSAAASRISSGDPSASDAAFARGSGSGASPPDADADASAPASRRGSGPDGGFQAAVEAGSGGASGASQHQAWTAGQQQPPAAQLLSHPQQQPQLRLPPPPQQQQPQPQQQPHQQQLAFAQQRLPAQPASHSNPAWAGGPPAPVPWIGDSTVHSRSGPPSGAQLGGGSTHHSSPAEPTHEFGNAAIAAGSMYSVPAADVYAHEYQQPPLAPPAVEPLSPWDAQQQTQAGFGASSAAHGSAGLGYSVGGIGQGSAPWAVAAPGGPAAEEELTEVAL